MTIISAGSSSSGNSYIIISGSRTIILDAGLPAKKITAALEHLGTDPADVDAVLITHEHIDHVRSVRALSRKCCSALFVASRGTVEGAENFCHVPEERLRTVAAGDSFLLSGQGDSPHGQSFTEEDIRITAFSLSHDAAEPLGFTVEAGGEKLAVVTDTGVITDEIYEAINDSDLLVFEANHDEQMLMFGEYPYHVKVRIKSDRGHLSNDYAGGVLARILGERKNGRPPLRIMLAHLSFHNNIPLFARQTVEDILYKNGFIKGEDYLLDVAAKEGLTFMPEEGKEH